MAPGECKPHHHPQSSERGRVGEVGDGAWCAKVYLHSSPLLPTDSVSFSRLCLFLPSTLPCSSLGVFRSTLNCTLPCAVLLSTCLHRTAQFYTIGYTRREPITTTFPSPNSLDVKLSFLPPVWCNERIQSYFCRDCTHIMSIRPLKLHFNQH